MLASIWKKGSNVPTLRFQARHDSFIFTLETFHFHPWTSLVLLRSMLCWFHTRNKTFEAIKLDIFSRNFHPPKKHPKKCNPFRHPATLDARWPTTYTHTTWHLRRLLPSAPVIWINQGRKCHQPKGFSLETGACGIQSEYFHVMMDTPLKTNMPPKNGILKITFPFPRWDMLVPWRVVLTCVEVLNWNLKRTKSNKHLAFKKDQNHFKSALQPMDTSCQRIFPLNEVLTALLNCRNFCLVVFQLWRSCFFLRAMKFNQHSGAAHMNLKSKMLSACVFIRVLTWHGLCGSTRKRGWEPTTFSCVIEEKTHGGGRITNMLSQKVM